MQTMTQWMVRAALAVAVLMAAVPMVDAATVSVTVGGRQINLVIDPDQWWTPSWRSMIQ